MAFTTPLKPAEPSPLLTRREAAAFLRMSPNTLDRYAGMGRIKRVRLGGSVRYSREELERITREGF